MRQVAPSGFQMEEAPAANSVITDTSGGSTEKNSHRELMSIVLVCCLLGNGCRRVILSGTNPPLFFNTFLMIFVWVVVR